MKRQHRECEKIFANYVTDMGVIYKIKNSCILIGNKQWNKKVGRRPKQTFLQRRNRVGQQTHEKMLNTAIY